MSVGGRCPCSVVMDGEGAGLVSLWLSRLSQLFGVVRPDLVSSPFVSLSLSLSLFVPQRAIEKRACVACDAGWRRNAGLAICVQKQKRVKPCFLLSALLLCSLRPTCMGGVRESRPRWAPAQAIFL